MKLAEALQERADLNRQIEQLKSRLGNNVLKQEGEPPVEDPAKLKKELDGSIERLEHLICSINLTNCKTTVNGKTLTELIAQKDMLTLKISAYKEVVNIAGQTAYRARGTEIKIQSSVSVPDWQKQIDKMAKELRSLDNLIQETNWKHELIEV